jgi:hypothetical protein
MSAARRGKRKCVICHVKAAEVPDRERMGRPINRVCRECHVDRLRLDLHRIAARVRAREERAVNAGEVDSTVCPKSEAHAAYWFSMFVHDVHLTPPPGCAYDVPSGVRMHLVVPIAICADCGWYDPVFGVSLEDEDKARAQVAKMIPIMRDRARQQVLIDAGIREDGDVL